MVNVLLYSPNILKKKEQGSLVFAKEWIKGLFTQDKPILFLPYAREDYDTYAENVINIFKNDLGHEVISHHTLAGFKSFDQFAGIYAGHGNTYHLLKGIRDGGLFDPLQAYVKGGGAFMGSSAGMLVLGPSIVGTSDPKPTNYSQEDMKGLNIIPYLVKPHMPKSGEKVKIFEKKMISLSQMHPIVGVCNDCVIRIQAGKQIVYGEHSVKIFRQNLDPKEVAPGTRLDLALTGLGRDMRY